MHSLRASILLSIILLSVEPSPGSEADRLMEENNLLKAEVQLAGSSKIYVIFDLGAKKITMKAKGVLLKELPVESCSQWGTPVRPKPLPLLGKSALVKPEKKEIKPKADGEENPSEPEVLQLEDMPARYRLEFEDGLQISVRPKSTGIFSTLFNWVASLNSHLITRPMGTLWNGLRHQSFTDIVVALNETDARSLYWSFQEGFQGMIICRDSSPEPLPRVSGDSGENRSRLPVAPDTFPTGEGQVLVPPRGNE